MITPGSRLGPYEIVAPLGAGGMGEVFRARDTRLDRSVAIKVLPSEFAQNAQLKLRFDREAKAISALNHPNICTLYDVGHEDGTDFLVLELIEGQSLADRLLRGALPLGEVLRYGAEIAAALDRAHRAGIVHRDLKPGNIMITKSGAKLLDFGLAKKVTALDSAAADVTVQKPVTTEGTIIGTFQYMAPEQLEGIDADPRSDIFALGAVLYEMATGKRAFEGKSRTSLIAAIVSSEPRRISEIQPMTPPALEHVVTKCLKKDPDERWQSAFDVADELRWIATSPVTPAARKGRNWIAASIALAAIAIAFAAYRAVRVRETGVPYTFTIPAETRDYEFAFGGIISPDGKAIAFSARNRADGKRILWVRPIDSIHARPLPAVQTTSTFFWSRDSLSIFFAAGGKLQKVSVSGGTPQPIADFPNIFGGDMNAGGDVIVAAVRSTGIHRLEGDRAVPITTLNPAYNEISHTWPRFLPDGRRFLFIATGWDEARAQPVQRLYAGSLDGPAKFVGEVPSRVQYAEPGYLLFVRDGALIATKFDADSLQMSRESVTLLDDVFCFNPIGNADFWVSDEGRLVVKGPDKAWRVHILDSSGRTLRHLGTAGRFYSVNLSGDGSSAIVAAVDPKLGTSDLWSWDLRRDTSRRLTFTSGMESAAVTTPDGARMYFLGSPGPDSDIFEKTLDGSQPDRVVTIAPGLQIPCDITPDGKSLLYQTNEDTAADYDLMLLPLRAGSKPQPLLKTPFREAEGRISPDGRQVAYSSNESGTLQVYVRPFPGPGVPRQISSERGFAPEWSADGRRIFFLADRRIMSADADGRSNPTTLAEFPYDIDDFDVAADGTFIAVLGSEPFGAAPNRVIDDWKRLLDQ